MRVHTAFGVRLLATFAFAVFTAMGIGFAAAPAQDTGNTAGDRVFFALFGVLAALVGLRVWRCSIYLDGDQLVLRGVVRTRQITLVDIRDVRAEQSDWMWFWVIVVETTQRSVSFEDVRDYPWRPERMRKVAEVVGARAREAGAPVKPAPLGGNDI